MTQSFASANQDLASIIETTLKSIIVGGSRVDNNSAQQCKALFNLSEFRHSKLKIYIFEELFK